MQKSKETFVINHITLKSATNSGFFFFIISSSIPTGTEFTNQMSTVVPSMAHIQEYLVKIMEIFMFLRSLSIALHSQRDQKLFFPDPWFIRRQKSCHRNRPKPIVLCSFPVTIVICRLLAISKLKKMGLYPVDYFLCGRVLPISCRQTNTLEICVTKTRVHLSTNFFHASMFTCLKCTYNFQSYSESFLFAFKNI